MGSESTRVVNGLREHEGRQWAPRVQGSSIDSESTTIVFSSASTKSASGSESTGYWLPGCRSSGFVVRCLRRALVVDVKGKEGEFSMGAHRLGLRLHHQIKGKKKKTKTARNRKKEGATYYHGLGLGTGCG